MKPAVIRTDRLTLLPLRVEHAEEMAAVLSDPALHAFIGGAPDTAEALRARYERWTAGSLNAAESWCNWVIQLDDTDTDTDADAARLTGTVQATVTTDERGTTAEIAWVVGTPWQGRGIATEAARALVTWLRHQGAHTITAHIHPDHLASAAVATAAGLTRTDHWHDGELKWQLSTID